MDLLKKNKHSHPLIYLRGLKSTDLGAIVNFLYYGEAYVFQEDLDTFLALAEEFKLKGLTGGADSEKKETPQSREVPMKKETSRKMTSLPEPNLEGSTSEDFSNDTIVALTTDKISVDLQELDEQIKSMITKSDVSTNGQGKMATCNACGKQGPLKHMPQHIEANHITGVSHACDICGKHSRSRQLLSRHNSMFHGQH